MIAPFDTTLGRATALLSVATVAFAILVGTCWWVFAANASHEKTAENARAVEILSRRELQREAAWGKDYWQRPLPRLADAEDDTEPGS